MFIADEVATTLDWKNGRMKQDLVGTAPGLEEKRRCSSELKVASPHTKVGSVRMEENG